MTGHVYASLAQFNDYLRDAGSTTFANESASIVARKLAILESVARDIDTYCQRSDFGSGFGPRTGTNRYDGSNSPVLRLRDDLIAVTSLTIKSDLTQASGTSYTESTDYITEPYDTLPKRSLIAHGYGSLGYFPYGLRIIEVAGSWGERDQRHTATATASAIADTTTTTVTVSAAGEFSPGQTLLIGSEQVYVRSIAGSDLTVQRGANGTTAATHGAAAAIDIYEYAPQVVDCELRLALRRWKGRDAGANGVDGGGEIPVVQPQSERSIMAVTLRDFRYELVR